MEWNVSVDDLNSLVIRLNRLSELGWTIFSVTKSESQWIIIANRTKA